MKPVRTPLIFSVLILSLIGGVLAIRQPLLNAYHIRGLQSPERDRRRVAAEELGRSRAEAAVPHLVDLLRREISCDDADRSPDYREDVLAAAEALLALGKESVPEVAELLTECYAVRIFALQLLERFGSAACSARDEVFAVIDEGDADFERSSKLKYFAARAMIRACPVERARTVERLAAQVREVLETPRVRSRRGSPALYPLDAALALAELGPVAEEAADILESAALKLNAAHITPWLDHTAMVLRGEAEWGESAIGDTGYVLAGLPLEF